MDTPPSPSIAAPAANRSFPFWILLVGAALHATIILRAEPLQSANDRSRWATVRALLEQGTYRIDDVRREKGWDTIDLIKDGDHFYSTKPPILATWVAGIVWCVERASDVEAWLTRIGKAESKGWKLASNTQAVTSVTLLFANGLPMLVSWILFSRMLRETMQSACGHAFLLVAAVFGTLLTPFSVVLNNHSVAAAGAMLTIYSLWRILAPSPSGGRQPPESGGSETATSIQEAHAPRSEIQPLWFALCGFFAGWTCAHELPAALLGVSAFLIACRHSVVKTFAAFVPAALVPLAFFFVTNWLATGSLKPVYADYGSEKYRFVIDGVPSYWMEPKGIDRNFDSTFVYLFHCLIGHHGIFSLTPVWLLLFPAWFATLKKPRGCNPWASALRLLSALSLVLTVVVLAFYLSRTENYNYGGNTSGLRWVLWLIPFWLVTLIPLVDGWSQKRSFRWIVTPLFVLSAFSAWSRVDNPWRHPWIFEWMEARGWVDISEPRPPLEHELWTWIAAIPDCRDGEPRWMEFVNAAAAHGSCRMRLEATPSSSKHASRTRLTVTRWCNEATPETVCDVEIDREAFAKGDKPAQFLHWPDATITLDKQQQDLAFLRGLPLLNVYRAGVVRYRKTPLRRDAFRCQHALSQVKETQLNRQYRCDVWLCAELPFGIAEVEFQVLDAATGLLLHQERWQAAKSEPPPLPYAQWSPQP